MPTTALTAELVELVDVPVMASGDITTARARRRCCDDRRAAVMIGARRPGQPLAAARDRDGGRREPSDAELVGEIVRFVREVAREMGPERATGWLRKFYGWYLRGGRLGAHARRARDRTDVAEVERLLLEAAPEAAALVELAELQIAALPTPTPASADLGRRAAGRCCRCCV